MHKMADNCPRCGAPCQILPPEVRMIMTKVKGVPQFTRQELVNDLKAIGTPVTKKTHNNLLKVIVTYSPNIWYHLRNDYISILGLFHVRLIQPKHSNCALVSPCFNPWRQDFWPVLLPLFSYHLWTPPALKWWLNLNILHMKVKSGHT